MVICLSFFSFSKVNSQTLEEELSVVYQQIDTAETFGTYMSAAAQFELIANMYSDQYAANYYAAYSKAMVSYVEKDSKRRDQLLDAADMFYSKVKQIEPSNQETYILGALLANARLSVDGGSRWKVQGEVFEANLASARAINPSNPRINYLKGVAVFHTPKMFGGGKKNALEYLQKAEEQFAQEKESSIIKPHWGAKRNVFFLNQCKED
jgi:hypothetical protein